MAAHGAASIVRAASAAPAASFKRDYRELAWPGFPPGREVTENQTLQATLGSWLHGNLPAPSLVHSALCSRRVAGGADDSAKLDIGSVTLPLVGSALPPCAITGAVRSADAADQSTYAFQTDTRVVLTDVTVTDANGNPVHGLPQAALRIFDNKQPQVIASFEEHAGKGAATIPSPSAAGAHSNDYLLHLPPVLNIVLIDIANLANGRSDVSQRGADQVSE